MTQEEAVRQLELAITQLLEIMLKQLAPEEQDQAESALCGDGSALNLGMSLPSREVWCSVHALGRSWEIFHLPGDPARKKGFLKPGAAN